MTTINAMIQLREIDLPAMLALSPSDRLLQRAKGLCRIVVGGSERGNEILELFQRSPLRVAFPRMGLDDVNEAVLINTGGGIAGGDHLECEVTAVTNASIAVTTQTAERVYRALDKPAHISTKLRVNDASTLAWLPQETIIFNSAQLRRVTEVEISPGAQLLALEWLVFGRVAHGEQLIGGQLSDRWLVKKDGRLIWADAFHTGEQVFRHLKRRALLGNCKGIATMIYFGPELDKRLEFLRDIAGSIGCICAATSVAGLMIVRLAAETSSNLKLGLRALLHQLGSEFGYGPFRAPKMWSC